jgi:hypothetical protein
MLVPRGGGGYAAGIAQGVLDLAPPGARLVFSCGRHISRDGKDVYPRKLRIEMALFRPLLRLLRIASIEDQEEAARRISASGRD